MSANGIIQNNMVPMILCNGKLAVILPRTLGSLATLTTLTKSAGLGAGRLVHCISDTAFEKYLCCGMSLILLSAAQAQRDDINISQSRDGAPSPGV